MIFFYSAMLVFVRINAHAIKLSGPFVWIILNLGFGPFWSKFVWMGTKHFSNFDDFCPDRDQASPGNVMDSWVLLKASAISKWGIMGSEG